MNSIDVRDAYTRYRDYKVGRLSYATVRDYCDSMDHLRPLTTINHDLKDPQRPWVLKAIIGNVPIGSKLLEIGGGEPYVASILARLGYEVTIVDPYDGSGNGPKEYEAIRKSYPEIDIVRDYFTHRTKGIEPSSIDCIYSISVLEHIHQPDLQDVFKGLAHFIKPGGCGVHAIDHVLKGDGDEFHLDRLRFMVDQMGVTSEELEGMLAELREDTETYYLSAYGHNLWRGNVPYDQFPMRICVSIQTFTRY